MTKSVGIQKCSDYEYARVKEALRTIMKDVPPPCCEGKVVLLKPNILSPKKPEAAICTHPVVVEAAVSLFLEYGAKKVLVGESPATANSTLAAKATGMYEAVYRAGGEWADFSSKVTVPCNTGKMVKSFDFASPFAEADLVVSVSKLKTHQLMAYTGAMKNLFGLVVGLEKAKTHYRFPNKTDFACYLTDLNIAAKPSYAIMDAIVGMEGLGGPGNGDPVKLGFLAASDNILALDWTCAEIVGYRPSSILNLQDALNRKIWLNDSSEIEIKGAQKEEVKPAKFAIVKETAAATSLQKMLPKRLNSLATFVFVKTPHFTSNKCIRCGKCIEICPPQTLRFEEKNGKKYVKINKAQCIHCFCCHEICPVDAITLKRF